MNMKINFLLSLVSLSLTVAATASTNSQSAKVTDAYRLDSYRVESARHNEAERSLEQGLAEMKASALTPIEVRIQPKLSPYPIEAAKDSGKVAHHLSRLQRNQS